MNKGDYISIAIVVCIVMCLFINWIDGKVVDFTNRKPMFLKTYTLVFDEPETVYRAIYGEHWKVIMALDKEWSGKLTEVK